LLVTTSFRMVMMLNLREPPDMSQNLRNRTPLKLGLK
jgi:hypothetical protein